MGMFLSMSGVIGRDELAVTEAMGEYATEAAYTFEVGDDSTDDREMLVILQCKAGVTVMYPNHYLEPIDTSKFLSQRLDAPVFGFDIADGDLWMYELYDKDTVVDAFSTLPDYWEEIDESTWDRWRGDANTVARYVPGVSSERIANYLVHWRDSNGNEVESKKAYPPDEHKYRNDWQLLDFMNALGFDYPMPKSGEIRGSIYRFKSLKD